MDVTFNKAPGTLTFEVKQGSSKVAQSVEKTTDNTVTLLFASKLTAGDYTITATTTDKKTAEGTFTAEAAKLAEVKFQNTNLVVSANTNDGMKTAYAMIVSNDQWGNHINLTSPTINISKGTASFKSESGLITATAPADAQNPYYVLNEKVVITVMYDNNQKVLTDTFTVVTASSLTELEFGELQTDVEAYKEAKLTQSNIRKNIYFVPVTKAVDSEGLPVTTDTLNKMLETKTQTLFISPNTDAGMIYADEFVEKKIDGVKTPCLVIKGGLQLVNLSMDLSSTISVLSQGGAQTTITVPVVRDPVIDTLTITSPDLYSGKEVKLTVTAVDQYGDPYDLYKNPLAVVGSVTGTSATYDFSDKTTAGSTATTTTFTITMPSAASTFRVVKNTADKTLDFYVAPVNANAGTSTESEGFVNISGTTANFKPIAVMNLKVNKSRTPDAVFSITDYAAKLSATSGYTLNVVEKTNFAWSDGVQMSAGDKATNVKYYAFPLIEGTYKADAKNWEYTSTDGTTVESGVSAQISDYDDTDEIWNGVSNTVEKYVWTATLNHNGTAGNNVYEGNAINLANSGTQGSLLTQTSGITVNTTADTGASDTMTIHLYKLSTDGTNYKIAEVSKKDYSFTITSEADTKFSISVPDTLYVGKKGTDTVELKIAGEDGTAVSSAKLTSSNVQIVDQDGSGAVFAFNETTKKISCTEVGDKSGTAIVTASIENTTTHQTQTVTATLNYSVEAPYVKTIGLFSDSKFTAEVTDHNVVGVDGSFGYLKIRDQYDTDYTIDGGDLKVNVQNFVRGTSGNGSIASAGYSSKANTITLYGVSDTAASAPSTVDVILSYKGVSGATETFTIGVTTVNRYTLAGSPTATLKSVSATAGSVDTMTYGTANATGITLEGVFSDGTPVATNGLALARLQYTDPSGKTTTIVPATTSGTETKPIWNEGSDTFTTDAECSAGKYTATLVVDGHDGEVTYEFTVRQKAIKAADITASTRSMTAGAAFRSGTAVALTAATIYLVTTDGVDCTLTAGAEQTSVTKTGNDVYIKTLTTTAITGEASDGSKTTVHNGQSVTVTPGSLNFSGTATLVLTDAAAADATLTITDPS